MPAYTRRASTFGQKIPSRQPSKPVNNPITIPLEPLKADQYMDPQEKLFLDAVEKGDRHTMIRCLQGPHPFNVNCTNMLGRSAIQVAVDNENTEIVELLLRQDGVKIGAALLYAIREGVYRIVEMLIDHPSIPRDMLGSKWAKNQDSTSEESSDYSPDISPVILAAHCNQFEILQLLLSRGANIDHPHELSCSCHKCKEQVHADSLRHSYLRINTYRALASPAWISLTCSDPVLVAFKLSWNLDLLALTENEFKDIYLELADQCKRYACDLLDQCRSSEEVIAVLNKENEDDDDDDDWSNASVDADKLTLSRLKLALKFEQKQFVAHPHCQQLLTSIWYDGLPGWRKRNSVTKFLICTGLICLMPFIVVYYLIFPHSKIGRLLRSPFMKFLYHSASFGVFLSLLIFVSTDISSQSGREMQRGPPPSELEWLIILWVTGFVWAECKQLWEEGVKAYIRQWWNWLDFIMLSLYLASFSCRLVAYVNIEIYHMSASVMPRRNWPENDPQLTSEGLFAVANVFSFARIIYLFQANQHLGPLQISLGCMLIDIAKFLFIFFLVLTSFACGMNQLYWYYKPDLQKNTDAFYTLGNSYRTLFWSLFSLTPLTALGGEKQFTRAVGELLFMGYHAMSIIVLVNMLIAMMSGSFQDIENHADREWKFSRSKLWMSYFDEGSTLPTPFNIIISPKSIYYFLRRCTKLIMACFRHRRKRRPGRARCQSMERTIKTEESGHNLPNNGIFRPTYNGNARNESPTPPELLRYQDVMRRLVTRYIYQVKKQLRQHGVNEDDLLEIKQDISSLRYELREDRKRESLKTSGHVDTLRRDIFHTFYAKTPHNSPMMNHFIRNNNNNEMSNNSIGTASSHNGGSAPGVIIGNNHPSILTQHDMDYLRQELSSMLRMEIQLSMQDAYSQYGTVPSISSYVHPTAALPAAESELYQTHLYTEL